MTITIRPGITLGPGTSVKVPVLPLTTDGLVLHYDFSNPTCYSGGVTVNDLSTANNEGSVVNAYGHISYVSSGTSSYFNWDSNAGGSGGNSFGGSIHTTSTNVYKDFTIILEPDFTMGSMGGIFCVPGDKSLRVYNNGWLLPNPGNDDDWCTSSVGATTFYVNGQASNQMLPGWNIIGGATNNSNFLTPKQLYIGTSGYGGRHMQGKIAVVLMYNRVLTQQEHLVNYNHYRARFGL
jgi:hypothetical protein